MLSQGTQGPGQKRDPPERLRTSHSLRTGFGSSPPGATACPLRMGAARSSGAGHPGGRQAAWGPQRRAQCLVLSQGRQRNGREMLILNVIRVMGSYRCALGDNIHEISL